MKAIYPGSFDPVTNGHLDIVERLAHFFSPVVMAVGRHVDKGALFTVSERLALLREVTAGMSGVEVDVFDGLLADYVQTQKARIVVRGLRAVSDFDYEFQMALMMKKLAPEVETFYIMTSSRYIYLSSSMVKEVAEYGGCISGLVPPHVERALREKYTPWRGSTAPGREGDHGPL